MAAKRSTRKKATKRKKAAERRPKLEPVGFAVIGLGDIAQRAVLPAFQHAKREAKLVALVSGDDAKRKQLGRRYGVKTYGYDQLDDCLAHDEVEAVYIALPNTSHREYAVRAARAGAHVLVEKPMATSVDECREMIAACRDAHVKLMVGYRLHFEESDLRAYELIGKGKLGAARTFASTFGFQVTPENIRTRGDLGGGPLWDLGVYCLNAARHAFRSEPIEVFASAVGGHDARFEDIDEAVSASLKFKDDRLATFTVSFGIASTGWWEVTGTKGRLRVEPAYSWDEAQRQTLTIGSKTEVKKFRQHDQFAAEIGYFAHCIRMDHVPEPSGEEGLADVRVIEALHRSIEEGKPIALEAMEEAAHPEPELEESRPELPEGEIFDVLPP